MSVALHCVCQADLWPLHFEIESLRILELRTLYFVLLGKKLRDGASNYTMRRFYDVAKEEFDQLEKLREVSDQQQALQHLYIDW